MVSGVTNAETSGLSAYPVGAIYMSINPASPGDIFGGTWERYAKGKVLVGLDESDSDFGTVGKETGEKRVGLTVNELPVHDHGDAGEDTSMNVGYGANSVPGSGNQNPNIRGSGIVAQARLGQMNGGSNMSAYFGNFRFNFRHAHTSVGRGEDHSNIQPSLPCYIWVRTS
jgi:microcystin-dependent protein